MTHTYQRYVTACICGQQPEHHVHTGTWDECPCGRCALDRETAQLWDAWDRLIAQLPVMTPVTPYEDVPATFKPEGASR